MSEPAYRFWNVEGVVPNDGKLGWVVGGTRIFQVEVAAASLPEAVDHMSKKYPEVRLMSVKRKVPWRE
jgi:hypothetical protein